MTRPSKEDLAYIGLTEFQITLLLDFSDELVNEVYREQLEALMSIDGDTVDF